MLQSQEPDPRGQTGSVTRWQYTPIRCGTSCNGYLAGHPWGTWVHWIGQSKPCKNKITGGALACNYCAANERAVWRGYTPWYDREYTRRLVLITEDYLEAVREIGPHAQIEIARGKNVRDPVVVREKLWGTKPLPPASDRAWPADLSALVLRLWRDAELIAWALEQRKAGALSDTPTGRRLNAEIADQIARPAGDGASDTGVSLADRNGEFVRRVRSAKPGANGQH